MREMAACGEPGVVGCTQVTEILDTPGVRWVGALPRGYELATVYTAAVCAQAQPARAPQRVAPRCWRPRPPRRRAQAARVRSGLAS